MNDAPMPNEPSRAVPTVEISTHDTMDDDGYIPRYFEPEKTRLVRSPMGSPRLIVEEYACFSRVNPRRIRPLSDPDRYISFWVGDDREVGIVRDPSRMDDDSRAILKEELDKRYFTPIVTKIHQVKERFEHHEWSVETNRGKAQFHVRGLHQNVKQLPPNRLLVTDVLGNRYDIPDVNALDAASYHFIKRHL
ncbi:MAG: DUF1854 domain-containing protein [Candidatus Poribacteria bacterium]|nr:DUF1854 domain-containing protein [Candidatus Poribacteria bacterium]